jgi:hypothetical protein
MSKVAPAPSGNFASVTPVEVAIDTAKDENDEVGTQRVGVGQEEVTASVPLTRTSSSRRPSTEKRYSTFSADHKKVATGFSRIPHSRHKSAIIWQCVACILMQLLFAAPYAPAARLRPASAWLVVMHALRNLGVQIRCE